MKAEVETEDQIKLVNDNYYWLLSIEDVIRYIFSVNTS